jgi:hypothetical protein
VVGVGGSAAREPRPRGAASRGRGVRSGRGGRGGARKNRGLREWRAGHWRAASGPRLLASNGAGAGGRGWGEVGVVHGRAEGVGPARAAVPQELRTRKLRRDSPSPGSALAQLDRPDRSSTLHPRAQLRRGRTSESLARPLGWEEARGSLGRLGDLPRAAVPGQERRRVLDVGYVISASLPGGPWSCYLWDSCAVRLSLGLAGVGVPQEFAEAWAVEALEAKEVEADEVVVAVAVAAAAAAEEETAAAAAAEEEEEEEEDAAVIGAN